MSLLSPDVLTAFVAPGGVAAVRRRGAHGAVKEKRVYPAPAGGTASWAGAAAALATALGEFRCRRLRVILSSHFTQLRLVPWRAELADDDEVLAMAKVGFVETFGSDAEHWRLRLSDAPPGHTRLAAAVAPDILEALEAAARDAKARLVSVQPCLVAAANAWRGHFGRDRAAWLVVHEEGRLCLALIDKGAWRWLRCQRAGSDWRDHLPDLVESEALLAGAESLPAEVLVFAPDTPELTVRSGTRLPFRALRLDARAGFSPLTDGVFGLAMIG